MVLLRVGKCLYIRVKAEDVMMVMKKKIWSPSELLPSIRSARRYSAHLLREDSTPRLVEIFERDGVSEVFETGGPLDTDQIRWIFLDDPVAVKTTSGHWEGWSDGDRVRLIVDGTSALVVNEAGRCLAVRLEDLQRREVLCRHDARRYGLTRILGQLNDCSAPIYHVWQGYDAACELASPADACLR